MRAETKYKGSVKLSAIGDALGWITEFEKSQESLIAKFGTDKIESFYTWKKSVGGRFYGFIDTIKAGSYSDDTQLLLAVARSIKQDGSLDHTYFAKTELTNWLDYARGGGRTVKTAAEKISRKSTKWFTNYYHFKVNGEQFDYKESGANGAAMRVLPIALANLGNTEKIKEEIFCNSIITHGHPRAILGAMLYGYAIDLIVKFQPEDFHWENYLTQIGLDFPKKFELTFLDRMEIREWLREWNKTSKEAFEKAYAETVIETQNQLRLIFQSIKLNSSIQDSLKRLGCFEPSTKGSGISTVIAGIYLATKYHQTPLKAIVESVNALGSDTDSIAAFTGGLIGALHGQAIIPDKWKSVQDMEYLDKVAERLLAISEERYVETPTTAATNFKVLNNPKRDDFKVDETIEFFPLGTGKIISIDKQPTVTKGKYNLLLEAQLDIGQSILVSKLFDYQENNDQLVESDGYDELLDFASSKLKPKTLEQLKEYFRGNRFQKWQVDLIWALLKNEE